MLKQAPCVRCGKLGTLRCSKCRAVNYCGAVCQREHWARGHKGQCRMLSEGSSLSELVSASAGAGEVAQVPPVALDRFFADPSRVTALAGFEPSPDMFDFSGRGIVNLGNTCYINSVLQCLAYSLPLTTYLQTHEHKARCRVPQGVFCAMCEMEQLVVDLATSPYHVRPLGFLRNLGALGEFHFGHQEDANTFLYSLFQAMQRSLYTERDGKPTPDEENTTLLHQLFGGHSQYRGRCMSCNATTTRYDFFLTVTLNLSAGFSLEEALRSFFFVGNHLDDWKCSACSGKGLESQTLLYKPHPLFMVHLMRFDDRGYKINQLVAYRPQLDLAPVMHPDVLGTVPSKYSLYAVVVHYGSSVMSGHYVAFVKVRGCWYLCDDDRIEKVPVNVVLSQSAYLLFYQRDKQPKPKPAASTEAPLNTSAGDGAASVLKTSAGNPPDAAVVEPAVVPETPLSKVEKPAYSVHFRLDASAAGMRDLVMRAQLANPTQVEVRATYIPNLGMVSLDCGPHNGKLMERLSFPLASEGAVCKHYRDAGCVVVVLPLRRSDEEAPSDKRAIQIPVELCEAPVAELVEAGNLVSEGAQMPPLEDKPKAAPIASPATTGTSSGAGGARPNWHAEASYRALYTAIAKAKAAGVPLVAPADAVAAEPKEEPKRNDPCPCGSTRKFKLCHGKGAV